MNLQESIPNCDKLIFFSKEILSNQMGCTYLENNRPITVRDDFESKL